MAYGKRASIPDRGGYYLRLMYMVTAFAIAMSAVLLVIVLGLAAALETESWIVARLAGEIVAVLFAAGVGLFGIVALVTSWRATSH